MDLVTRFFDDCLAYNPADFYTPVSRSDDWVNFTRWIMPATKSPFCWTRHPSRNLCLIQIVAGAYNSLSGGKHAFTKTQASSMLRKVRRKAPVKLNKCWYPVALPECSKESENNTYAKPFASPSRRSPIAYPTLVGSSLNASSRREICELQHHHIIGCYTLILAFQGLNICFAQPSACPSCARRFTLRAGCTILRLYVGNAFYSGWAVAIGGQVGANTR